MNKTRDSKDFGDPLPSEVPVAIIGAGPAGTCCAGKLLEMGIDTVLLERSHFPRFSIGESFLPRTLYGLDEAGLLEDVEAEDFNYKPGAVFCDGSSRARIKFSVVADSPFDYAYHARRARFDQCLTEGVRKKGGKVCFGTSLVGAEYDGDEWSLTVEREGDEHEFSARFVVDASGGARMIPRLLGEPIEGHRGGRGSVFAHLEDPRRPEGFDGDAVWIASNETDTWGWIIPFSDGVASVGFVGEAIPKMEGSARERFEELLGQYPEVQSRFDGCAYEREPHGIDAYQLERNDIVGEGYCLIGNSIGFIDPVFSSGITVATETAIRAADGIAAELAGDPFDWREEYAEPIWRGYEVFSQCIDCWYDGTLRDLIYSDQGTPRTREHITAILAGDVWDEDNPMTKRTREKIRLFWRSLRDDRQSSSG